jgi:predicted nuclease with TOPRIM domain
MSEEEVKNPEAVLAELRRAQADLKNLREEFNALKAEKDTLVEQLEAEGGNTTAMRQKAIEAETRRALAAQGIKDVDRLMRYVGTDGLDFDDQGKLTGLDERLNTLKTDLPEVFDPKLRVGGKADIHADTAATNPDPLREAVRAAINH